MKIIIPIIIRLVDKKMIDFFEISNKLLLLHINS